MNFHPRERERRIGERLKDLVLEVEAQDGTELLVRFVSPWGLLPNPYGWRRYVAGREYLQFYVKPRAGMKLRLLNDPLKATPHVRMTESAILKKRLKNGCLRLSPGARQNGQPKLYALKLSGETVERVLAWLPEARQEALADYRDVVHRERQERREEILLERERRKAVRFKPKATHRTRPSVFAERVLSAA